MTNRRPRGAGRPGSREHPSHRGETGSRRTARRGDEALKLARDQAVPLLTTFNATVASLLPILKGVVRQQEEGGPRSQQREIRYRWYNRAARIRRGLPCS